MTSSVNGIAMAYMISVALFCCCYIYQYDFAKLPSGRHPESRWAWLKSRSEINGIIAVLAGVLVYGGVHLIGLTANHEMRTLILIIITSLAFMSMVTALTTWNSRIGAFFSLILLLLQLASSAGTYPLALTNDFFKGVNPWFTNELLCIRFTTNNLYGRKYSSSDFPYYNTSFLYCFRYANLST